MNRETIIAISMGISLGAIVALVVLFQSNKADETKIVPVAPNQASAQGDAAQPSSPKLLTITTPEQGSVVEKDSVTITGKAPKNSLIIVQSPSFESTFKSKEETFSIDVDLSVGENVIQLSAYTESSTPQQQTLRVYFIAE